MFSEQLVEAAFQPQVWLKQPLVVLEDIVERHDAVEAFVMDPELRERLRDHSFRGVQLQPSVRFAHHDPPYHILSRSYVTCVDVCAQSAVRPLAGSHMTQRRYGYVFAHAGSVLIETLSHYVVCR